MIRTALVDRLATTPTGNGRPMLKANGGYLAKIGVLPRPLKAESDDELGFIWIALQGATPSLCVALGRMEVTPIDGNEDYLGELEIAVYALSKNLRAFVDGRMSPDVVASGDPAADPGIETMLEHVREVLVGQELDVIGVHEIRPKSEDEVVTDGEGALWEQRFTVVVQVSVNPQRASSDLVTSIEAQHELDGLADANQPFVDTITPLEVP
ncbi:MAG: hypothetical protein ABIY55_31490 [Kofleriaceae bacterium]